MSISHIIFLSTISFIYLPPGLSYLKVVIKRFARMWILKCLLKIILDLNLVFYEANKIPRFGIDDHFLKENRIKKLSLDRDYEDIILSVIKKYKINQREYENLIIDQGPLVKIIKLDSINKCYENLFELPIKFAFKKHPSPKNEKIQSNIDFGSSL